MGRRREPRNAHEAVAYVRVSTDKQELGPEAQRSLIKRWSKAQKVKINAWHEDLGVSGTKDVDKRPGLFAALEAMRTGTEGLLVIACRDRLARDSFVAQSVDRDLAKLGARVVCADGTASAEGPEGTLLRQISDGVAQYERAKISQRIKAALSAKKDRGERAGKLEFGWEVDPKDKKGQKVRKCPSEWRVIERILQLAHTGFSSRTIASILNEEDAPCRGERWHHTSVWRLLNKHQVKKAPRQRK